MRTQRTSGPAPDTDPSTLKQAVLDLLVVDHPCLWSLAELTRSVIPSSGTGPTTADLTDALEDLYAAGLIHRLDGYVFATRAAHQAAQITA